MTFAQNLARLRRQQNLTQADLAQRLNLTFQAISKWETGQSLPDLNQAARLADILCVTLDTLLGRTPRVNHTTQYERKYDRSGFYWGLEPNSMCYDVMRLRPPVRPLKVLDIGCGEGKDAVFFARNGYAVTAFDLTSSGLDKARRLADACGVQVGFFQADLLDYRPDDEYDIVFSSGVLHYIPESLRREVLECYQAHTAPGGLHAMNAFVRKPYLALPPDEESPATLWRSGELATLYADWHFHRFAEEIFDCNSSGIPHQHCLDILVAEKRI